MKRIVYELLNTRPGRMARSVLDAYMRKHPKWVNIDGVWVLYSSATDIDVNRKAITEGLGYDNDWILSSPVQYFCDLGCNTGLFTLWLSHASGWTPKGIAIDGNAAMCDQAKANFLKNGIDEMRVIHGLAGERSGPNPIHLHSITVSSSTVIDSRPYGERKITDYVNGVSVFEKWSESFNKEIDLMKVDIEGSEFGLFHNEPSGLFDMTKRIVVEWHEPQCNLTFIRSKLPRHRLHGFSVHGWIGLAYFSRV